MKDGTIDRDKAFHDPPRMPNFIRVPRRKDRAHGWLGSAFHHGLAFFVKAGDDRVVIFEGDEQGRQWGIVVVTRLDVIPGLLERKPGETLNAPQPLDPGAESAIAEPAQQLAVARSPIAGVAFQRPPDALRQCL
ncbi:MAG: hypothetical protein ABR923_22800, partial [Terracidiphilus sp.]